jgi:hypothetical protein
MNALMRKAGEYFRHGVPKIWKTLLEQLSVHVDAGRKSVPILDAGKTPSTRRIPGGSLTVSDWLPEFLLPAM